MKAITYSIWTVATILVVVPAGAQTDAPPAATEESRAEPEARDAYWLRVRGDRVNIRSRPDANSTAVARVDRDALLRGFGEEFGWHAIEPPAGAFCYVSRTYVDVQSPQRGVVSVRSGTLRARVGSLLRELDPMQSEVLTLLERGTEVRIVGEQGDWLRIAPPPGVKFHISAELVERISDETAARLAAARAPTSQPAGGGNADTADDVRVAADRSESVPLAGPWGQRLLTAEAAIQTEASKPLLERSWDAPIASLRPIAAQRDEPRVAQLAAAWIEKLESRLARQEALRAAGEVVQRESRNREGFEREMEQIRARRAPTTQPRFDAAGQFRPSNVAAPAGTTARYMLRDPLSGRVTAYLEFAADVPSSYLKTLEGRYVGVHGKRREHAALGADVIRVTRVEPLER